MPSLYPIEKDIPLPAQVEARYPFAQMEVGDSIFCKELKTLKSAAFNHGNKSGKKFTVQKATREGVPGGRCWRIA
jgi:hypothetical protein